MLTVEGADLDRAEPDAPAGLVILAESKVSAVHPRKARRPVQLELRVEHRGGKRKGAGRKPKGARAGVAHAARERFRKLPVHVTMRMAAHVYSLRSGRSLRVVEKVLKGGADRFEARVVQLSLQGNHVHLLVEAADQVSLMKAMKGLSVRLARRMNRMMGKRGQVIADRYHARPLRTPAELRNARHYIANNRRHHAAAFGQALHTDSPDPYASEAPRLARLLPQPRWWLLKEGIHLRRSLR
jgi:REP element-mobilizing transposase RayT